MNIEFKEEDLTKLTSLIRSIFSPDTTIPEIMASFPQLDEAEVIKLSNTIHEIRREGRILIPTEARQKEWKRKTHDIVRSAVAYFYEKS